MLKKIITLTAGAVAAAALFAGGYAAHTPAPSGCTFDGGGYITSGQTAQTSDGHVWACADGQLIRVR
jgi:hypothetical protein